MTAAAKAETEPAIKFDEPMDEAIIATASAFFFAGKETHDEDAAFFREKVANAFTNYPKDGRKALIGGMLKAGFKITAEPLEVDTPEVSPEEALDQGIFMESWRCEVSTLLNMGKLVLEWRSEEYDPSISQMAEELSD